MRNVVTEEGRALGSELVRLCDGELEGRQDDRCGTCAFRAGNHLANGSAGTLMTALKCAMEGMPFMCHEHQRACAGWAAMLFPKENRAEAPWPYVGGTDG